MRYRQLGGTGLQVSELGLGCAALGGLFSAGEAAGGGIRLLHAALDAGITYYDTSDIYTQGESERLIGRAFKGRRDRVIIATKGGYVLSLRRRAVARVKPLLRPVAQALRLRRAQVFSGAAGGISKAVSGGTLGGSEPMRQDFSPDHLRRAVEGSLRRLQTDYIDLYQLHSPTHDLIAAGAYVEVLEQLKAQGKIRHYGIAADSAEDGLAALRHPRVGAIMFPYGLLNPEGGAMLIPQAQLAGVGLVTRGCYGGGVLKERPVEELKGLTPDWPVVEELRRVAAAHGRPLLEIALQFSLRVPWVASTVLGLQSEERLAASLRFYAAPALTEGELRNVARALRRADEGLGLAYGSA